MISIHAIFWIPGGVQFGALSHNASGINPN